MFRENLLSRIENIPLDLCNECISALKKAEVHMDGTFRKKLEWVLAMSDFVVSFCSRDVQGFVSMIQSRDLDISYGKAEYYTRLHNALSGIKTEDELLKALRIFRNREMVRIAWRDLLEEADLFETMSDLSGLADACLKASLYWLHKFQFDEMEKEEKEKFSQLPIVIIGMGKLGGRELNFSSDIDLIFAFEDKDEFWTSNEGYLHRLLRKLIRAIGLKTDEGFAFRVDARLRPYGDSGPIVMGFDAMEEYYQSQGREWERYAWIKARVVAGDREAGKRLMEIMRPFVYRRYLDFGAFDALREMKALIEREIQKKGLSKNIKLGPGGIREIEFIAQTFQLLKGGHEKVLRTQGTFQALNEIEKIGIMPIETVKELKEAYIFLRNTEHRLQEFSDKQTQNLPGSDTERKRLAFSMGFSDVSSFEKCLKYHRDRVQGHFAALFSPSLQQAQDDSHGKPTEPFYYIWTEGDEKREKESILEHYGFKEPGDALLKLDNFKTSRQIRTMTSQGRRRLDELMPKILKWTSKSKNPTLCLQYMIALLETISRRSMYLALLKENPHIMSQLVQLFDSSSWIASFVINHPVVLDELLAPDEIISPPGKKELHDELNYKLETIATDDLEAQMDELRHFKQTNVFKVAADDVSGNLPLMKVSDHLTWIAEVTLSKALEIAWNYLVKKHGKPRLDSMDKAGDWNNTGFLAIALGKLGGIELGYTSDLDLVFLHSGRPGGNTNGEKKLDNSVFFLRLAQRLIHIMTAFTPSGVLYQVDMRLRPSGEAGILVSHIKAFRDYQMKKAWTWEHQAIVRARPVAGDKRLFKEFERIRKEVLSRPRDREALIADIVSMREKMLPKKAIPSGLFDLKKHRGGIVDIEFLVQYGVLLQGEAHPEILKWTDNVRLMEELIRVGHFNKEQAELLKEAYLTFRREVHHLSLQEKEALAPEEKFMALREGVIKIWRETFNHL